MKLCKTVWESTSQVFLFFPSTTLLSTLLDDLTKDVFNSIQKQASYVDYVPMIYLSYSDLNKGIWTDALFEGDDEVGERAEDLW